MVPLRHDFGGHVGGGPAKGVDSAGGNRLKAETKVDELQLLVPVEQDVLGLDVPVHNISLVQVLDGLGDGPEELLGLLLDQPVLLFGEQVVVEGVGAPVLLDQVYVLVGLDHLQQSSYDGVLQLRDDVDLPLQVFYLVGLVQPAFLVYFNGDFLVGFFVEAHLNHPEGPLPQLSVYLVVFVQLLLVFHL